MLSTIEIKTRFGVMIVSANFLVENLTDTEKDRIYMRIDIFESAVNAENKAAVFREKANKYSITESRVKNIFYNECKALRD